MPAYVVFTDATLELIAEVRPRSEGELLGINGVGKSKLERYSEDVLALLSDESGSGPTARAEQIEELPINGLPGPA